jgi:hypothetical protein
MRRGFVKLWRASADNSLYFAEEFDKFHAWTDLLLLANFKPRTAYVRGIPVNIESGQVLAAEEFLADRWGWSRGKVRRFLKYLSSPTVQQIALHKDNVCTVITVLNWNTYQGDGTADGTPNRTADGQQTDIPKNVKNVKNKGNTPCSGGGPVAAPDSDQGISNIILHQPEMARRINLSDELNLYRADVTSIACTICDLFPDKSGNSGGQAGRITQYLRTLAAHKGGGASGDAAASKIVRPLLIQFWSEIKAGEDLHNRPAGLLARMKRLLEEHGCL